MQAHMFLMIWSFQVEGWDCCPWRGDRVRIKLALLVAYHWAAGVDSLASSLLRTSALWPFTSSLATWMRSVQAEEVSPAPHYSCQQFW